MTINSVIGQMADQGLTGLTAADLVVDGKVHRFRPSWKTQKNKKRAWYIIFNFRTNAGVDVFAGSFGWFKGAECYKFNLAVKGSQALSTDDRSRFEKERAAKRLLVEQECKEEQRLAAEKANNIFRGCSVEGHSAYLQRKKVAGIGVRYSRGSVVVPVQNVNGELTGLQFINPNGLKRFLTGTQKTGCFFQIGSITDPNGVVGVGEGYATCASVHMATGLPVFVAFDAGNLVHIAKAVRERFPQVCIVIFGDDDFEDSENPGRNKAEAAAGAVGGVAIFPSVDGAKE